MVGGAVVRRLASEGCEVVTVGRDRVDLRDQGGVRDWLVQERPQVVVPRHCWQTARSLGAWTLVGCTVAPGFQFSGFELAESDWTPGE